MRVFVCVYVYIYTYIYDYTHNFLCISALDSCHTQKSRKGNLNMPQNSNFINISINLSEQTK